MSIWWILPNLAMADLDGAEEALNQDFVLINVLGREFPNRYHFPCYDPFYPKLRARLIEFIGEQLSAGKSVVVHCEGANDRSPDAIITYLMEKKNMSYEDAFKLVLSKKPVNQHPEWH